jgi:phage shock protein C
MYSPTQRLMRSRTDNIIAGVAGGIAQYLGIDAVFVRLALVVLIFTGVGVFLYPVLWLVMPLEGSTGSAPNEAWSEMRQQAMRVGDEIREAFVSHNQEPRRPRYDPMTGQPLDENEIPINNIPNVPPADVQSRRNRMLGFALLIIGGFILMTMLPGVGHLFGRFMFPALLIAAGVFVLRRGNA